MLHKCDYYQCALEWAPIPGSASSKEPACQFKRQKETQVQSLGQEDPLEEGRATHSGILAWKTPWTEEPGGLQSIGHKDSDTTERLACINLLLGRSWLQSQEQQRWHGNSDDAGGARLPCSVPEVTGAASTFLTSQALWCRRGGRGLSQSISFSVLQVYAFRAPVGRRNRWSRPDVSQKIWSWGSVGIRGFAFKFRVLETLSVLSSAPDRQNPTQGSSVKTLKSVSLQEARALFIHWAHLEVTCRQCLSFWGWSELKSECSAHTRGSRNVPGCQCPWTNPRPEEQSYVEHSSLLIPQGDTADVPSEGPQQDWAPLTRCRNLSTQWCTVFCFGFFSLKKKKKKLKYSWFTILC